MSVRTRTSFMVPACYRQAPVTADTPPLPELVRHILHGCLVHAATGAWLGHPCRLGRGTGVNNGVRGAGRACGISGVDAGLVALGGAGRRWAGAWTRESGLGGGGAGADGGDLVEGDAGGYAGVEGFGAGRDRDADQHVARLGDDAGQATALGAD